MTLAIRSSDLCGMGASEMERVCNTLAPEVASGGDSSILDARIRRFEMNYELSSAEMMRQVAAGNMKETAEIARWRILWSMRSGGTHVAR